MKKHKKLFTVCDASVVNPEVIGEDVFFDENPDQEVEEIAHVSAGSPCQTGFEEDLEELAR